MTIYITQRITKYYLGNHIKNTEMGRECNMHGERKGTEGFGGETRGKWTIWKT
jgi:hypothetical protein